MAEHATVSTIVGLQYGDEGKGMGVDRLYSCLSRRDDVITPNVTVRMNGTSQAAHNVVSANGIHHTFRQFGSGLLARVKQQTYFHNTMLLHPYDLLVEADILSKKLGVSSDYLLANLRINVETPVLLPIHAFINKLLEIERGADAHGSCGKGLGVLAEQIYRGVKVLRHSIFDDVEAVLESQVLDLKIKYASLINQAKSSSFQSIQDDYQYYIEGDFLKTYSHWFKWEYFPKIKDSRVTENYIKSVLTIPFNHVVFEMAQGVLLDETHGFHPHTTWSTTTLSQVYKLLESIDYAGPYHNYGMIRAYGTRHGHGPFPSEDSNLANYIQDHNNSDGRWQGAFRYGHLDLPLLRYALNCLSSWHQPYRGIDSLMISCADQLTSDVKMIDTYTSDSYNTWKYKTFQKINPVTFITQKDLLDRQQQLGHRLSKCVPDQLIDYPDNPADIVNYLSYFKFEPTTAVSFVSYSHQNTKDQVINAVYRH